MNNVRLVCGGYSVDLPTDFGIQINKSIADIREPESRSSDWTKTFTLPGTKTNNKLFTHLFDLNLSIRNTTATNFSPDFNPNLKADALLTVDEVTQIEGFIRLLSIKVNDLNQIEYECSMHGELADLFAKISDAKLQDLDFTEYNHVLNATNIFNSWNTSIVKNGSSGYVNFSGGAPTGEGYVYGWTDNGTYSNYQNLNVDNMTLYMYAKTVVDKIFSGAGYSYSSGSFFNSAQFKRLVVPCPTRFPILGEDDVALREFEAERSTDVTIAKSGTLIFDSEIYDNSNQYNNTTGIYTCQYSGEYNVFIDNNATLSGLAANQVFYVAYVIYVNGKLTLEGISGSHVANGSGNATITQRVDFYNLYFNRNDTIEIKLFDVFDGTLQVPLTGWTYTQKTGSILYNEVKPTTWGYDETIDFGGFFQGETKQREFMKWLFTMFNLYVEATDMNKTLLILPRDEFYTSTVRDWTEKRDLSQPLDITPMGELDAGKYLFTYSEGDDEDNKSYKQDFDRIYGDRQITINNDFIKDEKKVEIGFQPTTMISVGFDDKYLPGNSTDNQDGKAGKLRLLQYKYMSCKTYTIHYGKATPVSSPSTTTKTNYPYMGHLDDPLASTTDINFGMPRYIGLPGGTPVTNNNLYNAYWRKYINEIVDKDSKLVKGSFYLTPADIEKLSFRDLYFFDGNYFRLNKIEDYDPINPSVNICEFLFLKTGPTFTATTGSVGGGGTQSSGGSGDTQEFEYDPYDGSKLPGRVIQNKGFSVGQYNNIGSGVVTGDAVTNYGRANAAFATSGTSFLPDSERSIVIGEGVQSVGSDEVWLQGHEMTQVNFSTNRIQFTAATTVTADLYKDIYIMDLTTNTTLNLPDATTCLGKAYYVYKNTSAHQLIIDPYESQTIDDGATYVLGTHYECVQIVSDGTQWRVISKK